MFLGIDTSNYTTSLCVLDDQGNLLSDQRQVLQVPKDSKGLRQSEALFQHVKNLPALLEKSKEHTTFSAIGVSSSPRDEEGSYMPVFLAGESLARAIASVLRIPLYPVSHQRNHIYAGLRSIRQSLFPAFYAFHVSGGTTELLKVHWQEEDLVLCLKAASSDLHAGQFVDRVGVEFHLPFPAGKDLEQLALQAKEKAIIPSSVKGNQMSFSGPLTKTQTLMSYHSKEEIALGVFHCIARTLEKAMKDCDPALPVLFVGGVAANSILRYELTKRNPSKRFFFASPRDSSDNAIGAAFFAGLKKKGLDLFRTISS